MGDYFWGGDVDADNGATLGNFWKDYEKSMPATELPGVGDTIFPANAIENVPEYGTSYADWNLGGTMELVGGTYYGTVDTPMYMSGCTCYGVVYDVFGSFTDYCNFHGAYVGAAYGMGGCNFYSTATIGSDYTEMQDNRFYYVADNAVAFPGFVIFMDAHTFPGDVEICGFELQNGSGSVTFQRRMRMKNQTGATSNWMHGPNSPDLAPPPSRTGIGI